MDDAQTPVAPIAKTRTRVTMYMGDCLEVMPKLAQGSVNMVFADLPYGVTRNKWDVKLDLSRLWEDLALLSVRNAAMIFTAVQPFASALVVSNSKAFRYDLVWDKSNATGFLNANRMPLRRHESILLFYRSLPTFVPQKKQGEPYARGVRPANRNYGNVNPEHKHSSYNGLRYPTSIIQAGSERTGLHPTQKPIALLTWLIKTYSTEQDTILDPVSGSATTAVAAMRVGNRKVICIEKDAAYFAAGVARVKDEIAATGADVELIIHG